MQYNPLGTLVLTLFLTLSIVLFVLTSACQRVGESDAASVAATSPVPAPADLPPDGVTAYYFHGDRRCRTCLGIQKTIEDTIDARYAAQRIAGALTYQAVNTDQDANKRFTAEYDLAFSTLVLVARKGGATVKWENCDKVWEYSQDHEALARYVAARIDAFFALAGTGAP